MTVTNFDDHKVEVQIKKDIYPAFCSGFSNDLEIGPGSIDKIVANNSQQNSSSQSCTFDAQLIPGLVYPNQVELRSDISFQFTNVKIEQDTMMIMQSCGVSGTYDTDDIEKYTLDGVEVSMDPSKHNASLPKGMSPNPFQVEWAPCTNFLNAYLCASTSVILSSNGVPITSNYSAKMYDVLARTLPTDYVEEHWDGSLIPTKSVIKNQKYLAFKKSCCMFAPDYINANTAQGFTSRYVYQSPYPTYMDIEKDPNAATNSTNRGRIDRNLKPVFTFKKALASKNYILTAVAPPSTVYQLTPTAENTTDLYAVSVDGYTFPTNILLPTGMTGDQAYIILGDLLFWYSNYISPKPIWTDASKTMAFTTNEPAGQSMTVTKSYIGMSAPLCSPAFTSHIPNNVFSNTNRFNVTTTKNINPYECMEYMGYLDISPKSIGMTITNTNTSVTLTQYSLEFIANSVKSTSKLFVKSYDNTSSVAQKKSVQVGGNEVVFSHPAQQIGNNMPEKTLFYIDQVDGARITRIDAHLNYKPLNFGMNNENDLYRLSKASSLINYTKEDFAGYAVPYEYVTTPVRGFGSGTIVSVNLADYGIGGMIAIAGLNGVDVTISYTVYATVPQGNIAVGETIESKSRTHRLSL